MPTIQFKDTDDLLNGRSHIITIELSKLDEVAEKPVSDMSVQEQ